MKSALRTPAIKESLSMKLAIRPRLSPDGELIAYQERTTDWERNAYITQIRIAVVATGARFPLTNGKCASASPSWSPDSRRLAFLSDRDGAMQLYLISPFGGEAFQLTDAENGVEDYRWSPDGKRIAVTRRDPESQERKEEREKYGDLDILPRRHLMTHLWSLVVPDGNPEKPVEMKRLTEGQGFTVGEFSWSPDSRRIAFSASKDPDLASLDTSRIYVLNLAEESAKRIMDVKGPNRNPLWSPDGEEIAYVTANGQENYFYEIPLIAIVSADGGAPTVYEDVFDEEPTLIAWTKDGIYFSASQKTYSHLFRLNPKTKSVERITRPTEIIAVDFSIDPTSDKMALLLSDAKSASDVAVSPIRDFAPRRLTNMTEQYAHYDIAAREVIAWKSTDGTPIEGVLYRPANYEKGREYPLLCVLHGGPADVDRANIGPSAAFPIEQLAAKGALILRVNYRGSAGYGKKFRALNVRDLGLGDYEDVISGVDHLIAQGMADKEKVGAMGWSQGGYICAFLATYDDRFKAVSVGAGISDWMTYYAGTDLPQFTRQYLKSSPWDDPEIYRITSPIAYIKNAKTPVLIHHGENDSIVPISNAYELYRGLMDHGAPVKMIVYKGFGHGICKPKQTFAINKSNYDWFCQWIWEEKPDEK